MSHLILKHLFQLHRLMDEVADAGAAGGGGGTADLTIDIDKVSDEIGADLGLGEKEEPSGSATPPDKKVPESAPTPQDAQKLRAEAAAKVGKVAAARAKLATEKVDLTGKTDDEILALATPKTKAPPKSWKQEYHEHWNKFDPAVQSYVEQREAEYENGIKTHAQASEYGRSLQSIIAPYQPMLDAQGIKDHGQAVRYLMNAHYVLSTGTDEARLNFFNTLAKQYKVDPAKLQALAAANPQGAVAETPAEAAMRQRLDKIESDRKAEYQRQYEALKADADKEITAFAADPKNPYFKEVTREVALLLQDPNVSLAQAYEQAVWANPVTRAKEEARIKKEAEETARKEADEKAAAALKARGTRVRGDERHRASPDLVGSMDDTLRETYRTIQQRQE